MAVFRVHKTRDFTVMSNGFFRDMHLSLRAKGLLGEILTLPDDWDYTLAGLVNIDPEGKDAISATLRELEQAGYLNRLYSQQGIRPNSFAHNCPYIRNHLHKMHPHLPEPLRFGA